MIIVSQKKMDIINFENVNLVGANADGEIKVRLGVNDCALLGKYKTVERAEEVLRDIIHWYDIGARRYNMPEE